MTDSDFKEIIYFKNEAVKVTDLRITVAHVTVPLERIENAIVIIKTAEMAVAFTMLLLALTAIPVGLYFCGHFCWLGTLFSIITFVYLIGIYRTYTELKITAGSRCFKVLDASMRNREYIYQIADALEEALNVKLKQEKIM